MDSTYLNIQHSPHQVKVEASKLTEDPRAAAASVPGYDTFWCPARGKHCKGFNGVATYARTGLTSRACASPMGEEKFDEEGRCIRTDHANFVLFNVYVPNEVLRGDNEPQFCVFYTFGVICGWIGLNEVFLPS
jgi:exonuclease III